LSAEPRQGQLVRSLGLFSAFIITVSAVVGSGIYKKVAPMSAELGDPWLVILCWVLAGLISLFGALSNAEISGLLADSGGEYAYYRKIYNRFFAFLYGWSSFAVIRSASLASIAYVFAQSFHSLVSLPRLPESWEQVSLYGVFTPFDNFGVKSLAIFIIIALSYVNFRGLRFGSGLAKITTYIVVTSIFIIIILGFAIGGGGLHNLSMAATSVTPARLGDSSFISHLFAAMLAAFWAYEGWSSTALIGGEIRNPYRNLPLALIFGVLFVMALYCTINFVYLYILPVDQIIAVHQAQNEIAAVAVVKQFLGPAGAMAISLLILFTTFGATNSTVLPPPRLYYAMAKEGLFFHKAAHIHPDYHTPGAALGYQAVWSSVLVLSGSFDQLTDMLVFASFFFYGATTFAVFLLRRRMPDAPRPVKAWGYPVIPGLFIVFCITLIAITLMDKPREALLGLVLMFSGMPFYWYWTRRGAKD
jgi:APA family basic amino acid/polyamine antiporter